MVHCAVCGAPYVNLARCPSCAAPSPMGGYAPPFGAPPQAGFQNAGFQNAGFPNAGFPGQPWQNTKLDVSGLTFAAIAAAVLCQPVGIIAIIFLEQAKTAHRNGRSEEAATKLRHTKTTLWVGGLIVGLLVFAYIAIILFAIAVGSRSR